MTEAQLIVFALVLGGLNTVGYLWASAPLRHSNRAALQKYPDLGGYTRRFRNFRLDPGGR